MRPLFYLFIFFRHRLLKTPPVFLAHNGSSHATMESLTCVLLGFRMMADHTFGSNY